MSLRDYRCPVIMFLHVDFVAGFGVHISKHCTVALSGAVGNAWVRDSVVCDKHRYLPAELIRNWLRRKNPISRRLFDSQHMYIVTTLKAQKTVFMSTRHTRSSGGPSKRVVLRHAVNQQRIWGIELADNRRGQLSDADWWCGGGAGGRADHSPPPYYRPAPPHTFWDKTSGARPSPIFNLTYENCFRKPLSG